MKRILFFFTFSIYLTAFVSAQHQDRWYGAVAPYASDQRFTVDDAGKVYRMYAGWDGSGYSLNIERFEPFSGGWTNIYNEVAPSPGKIFTDTKNGVIYLSVMMDEPGKLLNVYKLESGVVTTLLSDVVSDYESYTDYAFSVGDFPGEYYWFMNKASTLEPMFMSYTGSYTTTVVDDLAGISVQDNKLLMQQVGDTLWLGCGEIEQNLRLFKTHKTNIDFLPAITDPNGYIYDVGAYQADESFLISDRISRLNVIAIDAGTGLRTEMIFNNGVADLAPTFPDYLTDEGITVTNSTNDKAYFMTNFAATSDPNGYRSTKIIFKDYNTYNWDTVGNAGSIFINGNPTVSRYSMGVSDVSKRIAAGAYNDGQYILRVLNDKPDTNTVIATESTTLCANSTSDLSLYSELSIEDLNNDSLRINDVSSSDQTILGDNSISFSTLNKIGNRTYFDIQGTAGKPGTTQLIITISDGYDTLEYRRNITFAHYEVTSVASADICGDDVASLSATIPSGTLFWYDSLISINPVHTGLSYTTGINTENDTLYLEAVDGVCMTGIREPIYVHYHIPPVVDLTADNSSCGSSVLTISAYSSSGDIYWFPAFSGGALLGSGDDYTTPLLADSTVYYAEAIDGICGSTRVPVYAHITPWPVLSSINAGSVCGTGSVQLTASAVDGANTIEWFDDFAAPSPVGTGTTYNTPSLTVTDTFYVRVIDANSCYSQRFPVKASVITAPTFTSKTDGARCGNGTVNLSAAASSGTIKWYTAASGGTPVASGTSFTTPGISATTKYYIEIEDGLCTSPRDSVTATINAIPVVTSTTPASNCGTGSVTLAATASAGTLDWYAASSGGSSLGTGTTYNTPSISSPTTYYVETSNGTCTSPRSAVVATISTAPTITGTTPAAICGTGAVTIGATASAGTISWFAAASGGTSLGTGTSFTSPVITSTTTYYAETTAGACTSARSAVVATINTIPTVTSTTPASSCGTGSVTLAATASAGTLDW
ncbi:MAG: immunoglobulin domain-containing protein, partial [Bacteroidota bacterium]